MIGHAAEDMIDFFEFEGRPVVVHRESDRAWVWSRGEWYSASQLIERCYKDGHSLDRENFIRSHPYAALELLDVPIGS